jgi:hypothetical protein
VQVGVEAVARVDAGQAPPDQLAAALERGERRNLARARAGLSVAVGGGREQQPQPEQPAEPEVQRVARSRRAFSIRKSVTASMPLKPPPAFGEVKYAPLTTIVGTLVMPSAWTTLSLRR